MYVSVDLTFKITVGHHAGIDRKCFADNTFRRFSTSLKSLNKSQLEKDGLFSRPTFVLRKQDQRAAME